MTLCTACKAELSSPLACSACGELFSPEPVPTPFQIFGLPLQFELDPGDLKRLLRVLSRSMHPDYFGSGPAELRELAERNTAILNDSYEVLADAIGRADWLVRHLEGPDENQERQMPKEFLTEVLEWNELLEDARDSEPNARDQAALDDLGRSLEGRRRETLVVLAKLLDPLPEAGADSLIDVRRHLNSIRYMDRTLTELETLALKRASTT